MTSNIVPGFVGIPTWKTWVVLVPEMVGWWFITSDAVSVILASQSKKNSSINIRWVWINTKFRTWSTKIPVAVFSPCPTTDHRWFQESGKNISASKSIRISSPSCQQPTRTPPSYLKILKEYCTLEMPWTMLGDRGSSALLQLSGELLLTFLRLLKFRISAWWSRTTVRSTENLNTKRSHNVVMEMGFQLTAVESWWNCRCGSAFWRSDAARSKRIAKTINEPTKLVKILPAKRVTLDKKLSQIPP